MSSSPGPVRHLHPSSTSRPTLFHILLKISWSLVCQNHRTHCQPSAINTRLLFTSEVFIWLSLLAVDLPVRPSIICLKAEEPCLQGPSSAVQRVGWGGEGWGASCRWWVQGGEGGSGCRIQHRHTPDIQEVLDLGLWGWMEPKTDAWSPQPHSPSPTYWVTYETLPKIRGEGTELRAGVIVRITKSG